MNPRNPFGKATQSRARLRMACAILLSYSVASQAVQSQEIRELHRLFQNPPDDSRIMMRWWWFGPTVTKAELEREMRLMKEGGIGGFEVQPVYPVVLDDAAKGFKTLPFLSDEFIDALRFTSEKARELGLRLDLTLGSGWPFGGPQVPIAEAAGRLRVERVKVASGTRRAQVPDITPGEKLLAVFVAPAGEGRASPSGPLQEVTDIKDGAALLPQSLDGPLEVQFYIASRTGMQVKRPALGGEGFVLDHLDRTAIENYQKRVGDRLMKAFGGNPPYAIFCDSLEVYNADWTADLLEEFHRRRGYDLKPQLPALVVDIGPKTAAIRHDWGMTLTELLNERFLAPMREWSRRNRTLFRIQDYGVPAAVLSSNAYADLPEGEGAQWRSLSSTRWASSASHLYGRPVTSSETWTWLHSPSFRATPLDMKAEADRHFLQGINQLIGHGWPYTAEGVEYPGWRFYAAAVFNEKNPWWIVMPDLARYLQRLSFLLRQGEPANDVAIYLPNDDAWARFTNGNVHMIDLLREHLGPNLIPRVLDAGYNFDFIDDEAFKQAGRVDNGRLVFGKSRYSIVILPDVARMRLDTLQKLEEFARGGGSLIATRRIPQEIPGFHATTEDHQKIAALARRIFEGASAAGRFVSDESEQFTAALTASLGPDLALSPVVAGIGFIHRRAGNSEIYFLANTVNVAHRTRAAFRVEGKEPEWWDPMTGAVQPAKVADRRAGRVSVDLELEPYESRVLVFSPASGESLAGSTEAVGERQEMDLSAGWNVGFGGNGGQISMESLRSWTDDARTRYFSGVAEYVKSIVVSEDFLRKGARVKLDFGEGSQVAAPPPSPRSNGMRALLDGPIREAAVIRINGRRTGSVWCPPYSIDVTDFLRRGENELRIEVGNTAINHMSGRALPDYRLLNLRYGERFQPQDMDKVQPVPSGLTGRVRLIRYADR